MRSSTRCGSWLCALVVACFAGAAAAQGPAPVPPVQGDPPGYRELVDEAVTEHRAGHFGEARALFTRAHNLYPNARTLKGLGMAEFELRNYRESAQYLEASLASTVKPLTPELRSEAEQLLARAQRFLGKVRVMVSPSSTQITVDGAVAPFAADGSVMLAAGDHTIEASAAGHEPAHKVIKINGGDDQTVTFQLTPVATAAGAAPPAALPVAAVSDAPVESGDEKPGSFRLYLGGLIGFSGNQSAQLKIAGESEGSGDNNLAVSYGFDVGARFFAVRLFDLGAELRLGWIKPAADETVYERSLLVDIAVKPRLRFDFAQGRGEFYLAAPVGLTIPSLPEGVSGSVGWNVGAGAGVTYFVSKNVGLNLEAMMLFHGYGAKGDEEEYIPDSGTYEEVSATLFLWQPTVFLNLVIAP